MAAKDSIASKTSKSKNAINIKGMLKQRAKVLQAPSEAAGKSTNPGKHRREPNSKETKYVRRTPLRCTRASPCHDELGVLLGRHPLPQGGSSLALALSLSGSVGRFLDRKVPRQIYAVPRSCTHCHPRHSPGGLSARVSPPLLQAAREIVDARREPGAGAGVQSPRDDDGSRGRRQGTTATSRGEKCGTGWT